MKIFLCTNLSLSLENGDMDSIKTHCVSVFTSTVSSPADYHSHNHLINNSSGNCFIDVTSSKMDFTSLWRYGLHSNLFLLQKIYTVTHIAKILEDAA